MPRHIFLNTFEKKFLLLCMFVVLMSLAVGFVSIIHQQKNIELDSSALSIQISQNLEKLTAQTLATAASSGTLDQLENRQSILQEIALETGSNEAWLALPGGTYYSSLHGNPHRQYLVTHDDLDHASLAKSLVSEEFWQFYFLRNEPPTPKLWPNLKLQQGVLLTIPLTYDSNTKYVIIIYLEYDDIITNTLHTNFEVSYKMQPRWPSPTIKLATTSFVRAFQFDPDWQILPDSNYPVTSVLLFLPLIIGLLTLIAFANKKTRQAKNTSAASNALSQTICDELNLMMVETDINGVVTWCKGELPAKFNLFSITHGSSLKKEFAAHPRYLTYLQHSLTGEKLTFEIESGDHYIRVHQWPAFSNDDQVTGLSVLLQEITEQRAIEFQLQHQQYHDDLTGLPNRQLFIEQLQHELFKAKRRLEFVAVIALELTGLGHINKAHGHEVADKVLKSAALNVKHQLRDEDTFCRFSGDEFILSFDDYHQPEELKQIAQRLILHSTEEININGLTLKLTANAGIATYPRDAKDAGSLINNAITAMRHARQTGQNTVDYFSADNARQAQEKWELHKNLGNAITSNEFELHFQPIFNLETNKCIGAEALARWPNSKLQPEQFIPLAEDTGLIRPLGKWVLQEALQQLNQWKHQGATLDYISVNLSVLQFDDPLFFTDLEKIIKRFPFMQGEVIIEITESVAMKTNSDMINKLNTLKGFGFDIAIDDFGTGFSSLNYLSKLPIQIIKIDRSFVEGITKTEHDTFICEAIINMALGMNLRLVAEGVETLDQMKWLNERGVQSAQGFFYAKALPAEKFAAYLGIKSPS